MCGSGFVVEDSAAVEGGGEAALVVEGFGEIGHGVAIGFDVARETVEAAKAFEFFGVAEFGGVEGAVRRQGLAQAQQRDGERQHFARDALYPGEKAVSAGGNVSRRFPVGRAVAVEFPAGQFLRA